MASACLQNESLSALLGANPSTERGNHFHMGVHPKEPRIVYPSGKYIVVRSVENPAECFVYRGHNVVTTVAKFSPNGYWVASADISGKVRIWAWDNPAHNLKIEIHGIAGAVKDLAWGPESKRIMCVGEGSGASSMRCFTWDTGNNLGEVIGHNKRVVSCDYKPTRPYRVMTCSEDMRTLVFAGPPFKLDHSNNAEHSNFVNCLRYSPNGEMAATCGSDYKIWLYDGKTGNPTKQLSPSSSGDDHTGSVYSLAWTADSCRLATASADKTVKLWDVVGGECVFTWTFGTQVGDMQVSVASLNGLGGYGFASVSLSGNINLLKQGEPSAPPSATVQAHQVSITALCPTVDPTTGYFLSGSFDGVVIAWDPASLRGSRLTAQSGGSSSSRAAVCGAAHTNKVSGIALSAAGVVSVGWDDMVRVGSVSTGEGGAYVSCAATNGQPCGVSASPASSLAAVATNKGIMLFRDSSVLLGMEVSYTPTCIALLGEEEVAVGSSDNKIHIYSLQSDGHDLTETKVVEGHRGAIKALAYSPDGSHLAAGDAARECVVWARGGWEAVVQGLWQFHTSTILTVAWSPSGREVATGGLDENVFVWSLDQPRRRIHYPFANKAGVSGLLWLSDDDLVSAGGDHCLARWNVGQDRHKLTQ